MAKASRRFVIRSLGAAAGGAALAACVPRPLQVAAQESSAPAHGAGKSKRTKPKQTSIRNIFCNQIGYLPQAEKIATVVLATGVTGEAPAVPENCRFDVYAFGSTRTVFTGVLTSAAFDAASGDHICHADFSKLIVPGRYRIEVLGIPGDWFTINAGIYDDALRLAMRFFYGQRCGCKVDLGAGYRHDSCHPNNEYNASAGRTGQLSNFGGWHDAGDYGRYTVNSAITCGTLLWAWELFPEALHTLFLNLPESGGTLPDLLAEVRWTLGWMLSMQDPADGGAWHKQTSTHFCGFVMPEKDSLPSEIIGTGSEPFKSTGATAGLAAIMAIAARIYSPFDPAFAAGCLAAARRAFAWCTAHPGVLFKNPTGITTGEYGDQAVSGAILWAAAELFRTTREPAYQQAALTTIHSLLPALIIQAPSWMDVTSLGLWAYALASSAKPTPATFAIEQATQRAATELTARGQANGYGNTLAEAEYRWGSNGDAGNQSLLLLIANRFAPNRAGVDAALGNLHYLLGRNCFGACWVTNLGVRPYQHPHHRPSIADEIVAPWSGMLSGGPNSSGGDPIADQLPRAAPMRVWVDDDRAYSVNEVAINWNASLVFLLAAAITNQSKGKICAVSHTAVRRPTPVRRTVWGAACKDRMQHS